MAKIPKAIGRLRRTSWQIILLPFIIWLNTNYVLAQQPGSPQSEVELVHLLATADPYDRTRLNNYLQSLPQEAGYFVVEGDILLVKDEVLDYLVSRSVGSRPLKDTPELLVNINGGQQDSYSQTKSSITYAIDQGSFPSADFYRLIVRNMNQAGGDWAMACPECRIKFVYLPEDDKSPSADREDFIVRFHDSGGSYLAHSFFPHESKARRLLEIDPLYFASTQNSNNQIGIIRHELGHILGYRHSRSVDLNGCFFASGHWRRFSRPFSGNSSVMEYFCTASEGPSLQISKQDRVGHRELYSSIGNHSPLENAVGDYSALLPGARGTLTRENYLDWMANPAAPPALEALQSLYPRDGNYFVVEGDYLFNPSELQSYLSAKSSDDRPISTKSELLVNVHKGKRDFYPSGSRSLTYFIDKRSFRTPEEYSTVSGDFRQAAHDWESVCLSCKLKFVELKNLRSSRNRIEPNFVIRYHDVKGAYFASAFFPHTEVFRRFINIDPSFFVAHVNHVSILRHQIGHILGYAHGLHGASPCLPVSSSQMDIKSLMQPYCDGSPAEGSLRKVDIASHLTLYGIYSLDRNSFGGTIFNLLLQVRSTLRIEFEGGDVRKNAGLVYRKLSALGVIKVVPERISPFQPLDLSFLTRSEIPYDSELAKYLHSVSRDLARTKSVPEGQVLHPNALLDPYTIARSYDLTIKEDIIRSDKDKAKFANLVLYETEANGIVKRSYRGYGLTLQLSSVDQLADVQGTLESANLPDTYVREPNMYASTQQGPKYYSSHSEVDATTYWKECCTLHHELSAGEEGNLGFMIGMHQDTKPQEPCGDNCPDVVILDSPVSLHQDFASSIVEGGKEIPYREFIKGGKQLIEVSSESVQETDHGTYMAGIIGCQRNDFGLIGVYPGVKIYALRWGDYQEHPVQLQDVLTTRSEKSASQIYLFANSWSYQQLSDEKDRFKNKLAGQIADERTMLWVVAAGQASNLTDHGADIDNTFRQGPMNLGDMRNVVVVTAVDKMSEPHLLGWVNYSKHGLVHIAAPGKDIPGTVSDGRYAVGSGTSPAAAFVAGTAAAMLGSSKYYQQRPERLKTRLQVTARPILDPEDSKKVTSGVLDYEPALLDPTKTWIKFPPSTDIDPEKAKRPDYTPIKATRWCSGELTLLNPEDTNTTIMDGRIDTKSILRIFLDVNKRQWFVFKKGQNPGEVIRLGPAVIRDLPLFGTSESVDPCPGKVCGLSALEDLIIEADHLTNVGCDQ